MKGFLIFMPLAVISLILYVSQSDSNRASLELEKEKQRLERMQFDKDFDDFWDNKKANRDDDLKKQREKVDRLEQKNDKANQALESVHQVVSEEMKDGANKSGLIDFENEVKKER